MKSLIWIAIFLLGNNIFQMNCLQKKPKIAIVGAGIGGAASSHFLKMLFGQDGADIDVYEKEHVGGRLAITKIDDHYYEVGGSAIHPKNKYMGDFLKQLGLSRRHVFGIRLGIYDGKEYLLLEGDRPVSAYGQLFHRYGNSLTNWHTVIDKVLKRFLRIYEVQDKGFAFTTVEKLLTAADPFMVNLTQITAKQFLLENNLHNVFVNEIATGVIRICYGQTTDVNAFVGTISLAGAKAGLWGVRGGNEKIPQTLIEKTKANLIWAKVSKIKLNPDSSFEVISERLKKDVNDDIGPELNKTYDMVIVATPLINELSNITFEGFPEPLQNFKGRYHPSVTTLVSGVVNTSYLQTSSKESDLDEILTTTDKSLFNSITRVYPVDVDEEWNQSGMKVWKVVSQRPLSEEELDLVFAKRKSVVLKSWLAYPHYTPPETLGPFVLHPGIFYTSSIDWAASGMEMSAISGKNAALLAFYHWRAMNSHVDSFPGHHTEL